MEKFNIRGLIGKGEFSEVFKGREKQRIEFLAIKRVEKSRMDIVVAEVQILHKLKSPHVLRFIDWYETRNNLWLILEYCTGGDLEKLLNGDIYLPESSIRAFGQDMLAGLKYLHTHGVLHCDLQPKNFLIDEFGLLKIADFKFAQKVPKSNHLAETLLSSAPPSGSNRGLSATEASAVPVTEILKHRKGSPFYLAPELFTVDGVYSFHSDLWALGCILYLMQTGSHPFSAPASAVPSSNEAEDASLSLSSSTSLQSLAARVASYDPLVPTRLNPLRGRSQSMDDLNSISPSSASGAASLQTYSGRIYSSPAPTRDNRRRAGSRDTPLSLPSSAVEPANEKTPEQREHMSASLCDLLHGLLTKCALYRPSWSAVEAHSFWSKPDAIPTAPSALPVVTMMPPQPAYEAYLKRLEEEIRTEKVSRMRAEVTLTLDEQVCLTLVENAPVEQIFAVLSSSMADPTQILPLNPPVTPGAPRLSSGSQDAIVVGSITRHTPAEPSRQPQAAVFDTHSTPVHGKSSSVSILRETPASNVVLMGTLSELSDTRADIASEVDSRRMVTASPSLVSKPAGVASVIRNLQSTPARVLVTPVKANQPVTRPVDNSISPGTDSGAISGVLPIRTNVQSTPFRVVPGLTSTTTPGTGTTKASDSAGTPSRPSSTANSTTGGAGAGAAATGMTSISPRTPERKSGSKSSAGASPVEVSLAPSDSSHSHSRIASSVNSPVLIQRIGSTRASVATPVNKQPVEYTSPGKSSPQPNSVTITPTKVAKSSSNDSAFDLDTIEADLTAVPEELQPTALMFHPSDTFVQPIVGNRSIEIPVKPTVQVSFLVPHFAVLSAERLKLMPVEQVDAHLSAVYKLLVKCTSSTPMIVPASSKPNIPSSATNNTSVTYQTALLIDRTNVLSYLLSIASVEEVASKLLSPPFIGLLWRSVSQKASGQTPSGIGTRGAESTVLHTVHAQLNACRVLAADVIANCIRYCKEISPLTSSPAANTAAHSALTTLSEGSLLYTIVKLLQTDTKLEVALQRRLVAAVGELVFYIATQNESLEENVQQTSTRIPSRSSAAAVMYGSSTTHSQLSNQRLRGPGKGVIAVDPAKWQLPCTLTDFLLSLLQPSVDETVMHYAAKAIENVLAQGEDSFKWKLVFENSDLVSTLFAISSSNGNENLQACCASSVSLALQYSLSSTDVTRLKDEVGSGNSSGGSADTKARHDKLVSKALGSVDMRLFTTALHEGSSKRKQAYLNILNILLTTAVDHSKSRSLQQKAVTTTGTSDLLQSATSHVLSYTPLHETIVQMMDQTSSAAIRTKGFLSVQLLCRHKPDLLTRFADSRLPVVLYKSIETVLSATSDPPIRPNQNNSSVPQHVKSALSLLRLIKTLLNVSARRIWQKLDQFSHSNFLLSALSQTDLPASASICTACVIFVSVHPLLRKLVLCSNGSASFLQSVCDSLRSLVTVTSRSMEFPSWLDCANQALNGAFEALSQLPDLSQPVSWSFSTDKSGLSDKPSPVISLLSALDLLSSTKSYYANLHSLLAHYIPTLAQLLSHQDADSRMLAITCARKIVPELVTALSNISRSDYVGDPRFDVYRRNPTGFISALLPSIPTLLRDHAPIPQYTIRFLSDILVVSDFAIDTIIIRMHETNVLTSLVGLLNPSARATRATASQSRESLASLSSQNSGDTQMSLSMSADPNLLALVHTVLERLSKANSTPGIDSDQMRLVANKLLEGHLVKHLSRTLVAITLPLVNKYTNRGSIKAEVGDTSVYSCVDSLSVDVGVVRPVLELLCAAISYALAGVEDSRSALSSCTRSAEFSLAKSKLQSKLSVLEASADCFIPLLSFLHASVRAIAETAVYETAGGIQGGFNDVDFQGSFVAVAATTLDLIFQLFPDKVTYALLTVSESTMSEPAMQQLKYLLGAKVIEFLNPLLPAKLITIMSHIAKIAVTLQVASDFKHFVMSPQHLGSVWPGVLAWADRRRMDNVRALVSALLDQANRLE